MEQEPEQTKGRSEEINLEYKVEFEDGFKPLVLVYGFDEDRGRIYGAEALFGVAISVGESVHLPHQEESDKGKIFYSKSVGGREDISRVVINYETNVFDGWEESYSDRSRKTGINVIKVNDRSHIFPALDRHEELYIQQFRLLREKLLKTYEDFVAEHSGLFK